MFEFLQSTGLAAVTWQQVVMIAVSGLLLYLALRSVNIGTVASRLTDSFSRKSRTPQASRPRLGLLRLHDGLQSRGGDCRLQLGEPAGIVQVPVVVRLRPPARAERDHLPIRVERNRIGLWRQLAP